MNKPASQDKEEEASMTEHKASTSKSVKHNKDRSRGSSPKFNGEDPFEPDPVTTWDEINLGPILRGKRTGYPPTVGARDDGCFLLYRAKIHAINSASEAGKTFIALEIAAQEMRKKNHVAYLDFEDSAEGIVERLVNLGVTAVTIRKYFHYFRPDEPLIGEAASAFYAALASYDPLTLAVIDGVTEAFVMHGYNVDSSNTDAARFMALLPRPLARAGIAVLALDHVTKIVAESGKRSRFAMGPQHKLSGADGVIYSLENVKHFSRGHNGSATLMVNKDRPGWVRAKSPGDIAAKVKFTAGTEGKMRVELGAFSVPDSSKISVSATTADSAQIAVANQAFAEAGGSFASLREACRAMEAINPKLKYRAGREIIGQLIGDGKVVEGESGKNKSIPLVWVG